MKRFVKLLFAVGLIGILFVSCQATPKTTAYGKENVAYLQIESVHAYDYEVTDEGQIAVTRIVTVTIDDTAPFQAKVNDAKTRSVKNKYTYKIAVGAHDIVIRSGDAIITTKKIFTSANEVKIVEVP